MEEEEEETNKNNNSDENLKKKYIKIMCLLLIDNTNKDIVKLYLIFLKNNVSFIKNNNLLTYEKEINKYKVIFTIDEMNMIENNIKLKSQKDIFLDYLKYILAIDFEKNDNSSFLEETKNKLSNLFLFNIPIEFDNEELYYYKYYYFII